MKVFLLLFFLFNQAFAGFPPTTTKASGDSTAATTFNFNFPNFAVTRSGVTTTFGVNGLAGGGTGANLSPVPGGLVYSTGSKFGITAAGSSGDIAFSTGAGAPVFHPPSYLIGSYWGISGNSGTSSGTNFLGTTDNQSLLLKTNGATRLTLDTAGLISSSGSLDMTSHKIINVNDPTNAQDAATKNYVDTIASSLNPMQAAYAGTIGSNIVGTYSNGAAGVGATFTVTATGAFTLDGTTPPVNSRILIKDQTSGFQNGVYNLTATGSVGVSPVLTRALDYNSTSNINAGDLIPVVNGTVNSQTSWLQTATVNTVGTDPLVFVQWTANPSSYLLKVNNLSDLNNIVTARTNLGLGSAATVSISSFDLSGAASAAQALSLQIANNLSDVNSKALSRSNLNIDAITTFSNANYALTTADKHIFNIGALTGVRTVTLPLLSTYTTTGKEVIIGDQSNSASPTNYLHIVTTSPDTFMNGSTSLDIQSPGGFRDIIYNKAAGVWNFDAGSLRVMSNLSDVASAAVAINNIVPSQTGNAGKILTTNGSFVSWAASSGSGGGGVTGPGSSTNNSVALWNGTSGSVLKDGAPLYVLSNAVGIGNIAPSASLDIIGTLQIANASSMAFAAGASGTNGPAFQVDTSHGQGTGIVVYSNVAGNASGATIAAQSTGVDEDLVLQSKNRGFVTLNGNPSNLSSSSGVILQSAGVSRFTVTTNRFQFTPGANATASNARFLYTIPNDATLTAATEAPEIYYNLSGSRQHTAGTPIALQRDFRLSPTSHTGTANTTITSAAALAIDGAPIAGTNMNINSTSALLIPGQAVGSAASSSYGLNVTANTGATNNYAAVFMGGNVGIGAAASFPTQSLDVGSGNILVENGTVTTGTSSSTITLPLAITNINSNAALDRGAGLNFKAASGNTSIGTIQSAYGDASGTNAYMSFSTRSGNAITEAMRITSSGDITNAGLVSPGASLDIKNSFRLRGTTSGFVQFNPPAVSGSTIYTLPSQDGSASTVLSTNGSGVLSWNAAATAATWQTGTCSGTMSTNTTTTCKTLFQNGILYINAVIAFSGAPNTASIGLNIPTGFTVNTAGYPNAGTDIAVVKWHGADNGIQDYSGGGYCSSTGCALLMGTGAVTNLLPFSAGNTDYYSVHIELPATSP